MDVEITPEPREDERRAILEALADEAAADAPPTPWQAAALRGDPAPEAGSDAGVIQT